MGGWLPTITLAEEWVGPYVRGRYTMTDTTRTMQKDSEMADVKISDASGVMLMGILAVRPSEPVIKRPRLNMYRKNVRTLLASALVSSLIDGRRGGDQTRRGRSAAWLRRPALRLKL